MSSGLGNSHYTDPRVSPSCQKTATTTANGCHVFGIETSCDDTGVAILRQDGFILSNRVHSQMKQHLNHGGIIPMMAKEYHINNIDRVAKEAFLESGLASVARDIDAIAVTTRPGLDFSLKVGLNYARQLAKKYSKPLIPIHHMQAHSLMPLLENRSIKFPYLTLLISGGHCLLAICERYNKFHVMGQSLDDAPGELLDKVARRMRVKNLGDPYDRISGGAAVELLARQPNSNRFKYFNDDRAVPMLRLSSCNFSFSGYRGNFDKIVPVIDDLWAAGNRSKLLDELGHLCSSLQRAILVQIFRKLQRALLYYRMHWRYNNPGAFQTTSDQHLGFGIREANGIDDEWPDIVVSGGVAANKYFMDHLRSCCASDIESTNGISIYAPSTSLCGDNGLMIAWNGMLRYLGHVKSNLDDLDKGSQGGSECLNDSVIFNLDDMDGLETMATSLMGLDITKQVSISNFKLAKPNNPELKMN